ncbi:MAG: flavin-dependent monooxygenase [Halieaceae bacterium]|jgi:3-hydroxy-9,10-secoandrosta-1,3,5(10)-triene-9,17-dione monooxygenase|uniref:flavin-dependent monooxygenase n=1 Tax=Haliea alexandrii TaxID=2448162 RepID=UPI000F0B955C|nr:flavin-dependent monooxygenase [Haliea alexandrii]MCR9184074.1 flavin-dependent monooxygenase [Halieaceae bacterium]
MTLPATPLTHRPPLRAQDIYDRVLALGDMLRKNAPQAREQRMVPQENIDALRDAGFFLALQPRKWGGHEVDPQDFFRMHLAIAENCMSTAWASGIVAVHAFQIALMDERAQTDVWGEDVHVRASSSYAPMGKVTAVEGGFRFSGRWGWSSGSDHCTWALLGGIDPEGGFRTFLVPRTDYRIEDTWHVMGLQGTGSKDIVVEDVFVPEYRTHKAVDGFLGTNPGVTADSAPLYRLPWAQLFVRVVSTPAIGAARDALDLYRQMVVGKASGDVTKLAADTGTQERIAAAITSIDEMEAILFRNFDRMMAQVTAGEEVPVLERIKYRYQASLVIERCMAVIDSLFSSAGGSSVFLGSEIQQRFLDIHTARAHVANNPTSFGRNLGAVLLGADSADFFV